MNPETTFYQMERLINYNYAHLLNDADFVNIPLPEFRQFKIYYLKETDSTNVFKGGCITFSENNYMIQNQVSTTILFIIINT